MVTNDKNNHRSLNQHRTGSSTGRASTRSSVRSGSSAGRTSTHSSVRSGEAKRQAEQSPENKLTAKELYAGIRHGLGLDEEYQEVRKPSSRRTDEAKKRQKRKVISIAEIRAQASRKSPRELAVQVVKWTMILAVCGYFLYNVYFFFYAHRDVEMAMLVSVEDTIDTVGVSIRNESIITADPNDTNGGVMVSAVDSGSKVSKGEPIARIFSSSEAARAFDRIADIDAAIQSFDAMSTAAEDTATGISTLEKQLSERLITLSRSAFGGDLSEVNSLGDDILYLLNKQQIATNLVESFDSRINELQSERSTLTSDFPAQPKVLTSPKAGYFIDCADGYENLLSADIISSLTPERLDEIMKSCDSGITENAVGKIADSYIWYIACEIKQADVSKFETGAEYTLRLPYSGGDELKAKLKMLNNGEAEDRYLLIFECTYMVTELSDIREQPVTIILSSSTGLQVNSSSIVYVDPPASEISTTTADQSAQSNTSQTTTDSAAAVSGSSLPTVSDGDSSAAAASSTTEETSSTEAADDSDAATLVPAVYIKWGNEVKLRYIEIISENDDKVLCQPRNRSGWLKMYDEVITNPKGLHDGKIISGRYNNG